MVRRTVPEYLLMGSYGFLGGTEPSHLYFYTPTTVDEVPRAHLGVAYCHAVFVGGSPVEAEQEARWMYAIQNGSPAASRCINQWLERHNMWRSAFAVQPCCKFRMVFGA